MEPDAISVMGVITIFSEDKLREMVKHQMRRRGISQKELCLSIGMARSELYNWLKGKHSMQYKNIWRIMMYIRDI